MQGTDTKEEIGGNWKLSKGQYLSDSSKKRILENRRAILAAARKTSSVVITQPVDVHGKTYTKNINARLWA